MQPDSEETNRTAGPGPRFVPSEAWIDAFEAQLTAKRLEERLHRYARVRANMIARAGRPVDDLYARELVQDAIEDTLDGVLAWDPDRCSLDQHLFGAIRSRTRHEYMHAQRFPHLSFDVSTASSTLIADVETSLANDEGSTASAEVATAAAHAIAEIARVAAADPDVLALLDAYRQEATKKADVLRVSRLTAKRYEAARKRMQRIVLQLPTEVRDAVRA